MSNDAQAERKTPRYTEQQTLALAAYVAANGGGADIVYNEDGTVAARNEYLDYTVIEFGSKAEISRSYNGVTATQLGGTAKPGER